jgi:hypothetical protein
LDPEFTITKNHGHVEPKDAGTSNLKMEPLKYVPLYFEKMH